MHPARPPASPPSRRRETQRRAALIHAHHAAELDRARLDLQRVQLELVRATADDEIKILNRISPPAQRPPIHRISPPMHTTAGAIGYPPPSQMATAPWPSAAATSLHGHPYAHPAYGPPYAAASPLSPYVATLPLPPPPPLVLSSGLGAYFPHDHVNASTYSTYGPPPPPAAAAYLAAGGAAYAPPVHSLSSLHAAAPQPHLSATAPIRPPASAAAPTPNLSPPPVGPVPSYTLPPQEWRAAASAVSNASSAPLRSDVHAPPPSEASVAASSRNAPPPATNSQSETFPRRNLTSQLSAFSTDTALETAASRIRVELTRMAQEVDDSTREVRADSL